MGLKVKATARGYYGDLIEEGREFEIADLAAYSKHWMEPIGWKPEEERAKLEEAKGAAQEKPAPDPKKDEPKK